MAPATLLCALDDAIQSRSILQHPFYQAWEHGALTRPQLATYARVYYPHVRAFPGYLERALEHDGDPSTKAALRDNLDDERHHPAPHGQLWLDFAEQLGLDRQGVEAAPAHPAARRIINTFETMTSHSLATGLAALYAYESQQPDVAATKAAGLRTHYGISTPAGLAYFDVHQTTDTIHRQGERDGLAACLATGTPPDVVTDAASQALDAYWGLLDGVCGEVGISTQ